MQTGNSSSREEQIEEIEGLPQEPSMNADAAISELAAAFSGPLSELLRQLVNVNYIEPEDSKEPEPGSVDLLQGSVSMGLDPADEVNVCNSCECSNKQTPCLSLQD